MKTCDKQYLVVDYFFDELSQKQKNEFEKHLAECEICKNYEDVFSATAPLIKKQKRILPEKKLINQYYRELKTKYYTPKKFYTIIKEFYASLIIRPSFPVRVAEAAVLILIGIFIGKEIIWKSQPVPVQQFVNDNKYATSYVSDLVINNYLQETEMVLLDVANVNPNDDEQILLSLSQLAQYGNLLQKTSLCRTQAEETKNEKLINLTDDIELILLELCNVEKKTLQEKVFEIRRQINESNLLFEIENFSGEGI